MKKLLLCVVLLSQAASGCNLENDSERINAVVINAVDGDTVDVELENGKTERVRLLLIDTPETKHPQLGVQPFGPEASQFTKETLEGKEVELEFDVSERDRYGRVLAYIWLEEQLFNEDLLQRGLARLSIYPPDIKYVDEFEETQDAAQMNEIGIWSIENYVTDKGYSHQNTMDKSNSTVQPEGCEIKGNINSKGEKIYHEASSRNYKQTIPEEWFCSVSDAKKAGYRAPK
ncbi:nuclease [Jeotgalibacillus sp. S-D1]|uniref:thermonuclease family protein n=1 Tax=Jeotgalibacillus sp. S-D1 TaxID=2552189 RepID=UPI00105A80D9|nr:thermonuclease family protein [Jeotgalibacillus sp. S-D1]TDL34938.1 nuclease [Jeotgalibacillus sp. S-D1]